LDKASVKLVKVLYESTQKIGVYVDQLCEILLEHERRLHEIEVLLKLKTSE